MVDPINMGEANSYDYGGIGNGLPMEKFAVDGILVTDTSTSGTWPNYFDYFSIHKTILLNQTQHKYLQSLRRQ